MFAQAVEVLRVVARLVNTIAEKTPLTEGSFVYI